MSFYYQTFISNLKKNNVQCDDTIHSVMLKLESSSYNVKHLPKIKTFVRKYWPFEKTILNAAYINFKNDSMIDPASSMVNEGQNFVVFEDTIFSVCPNCKGRIFPEFNHCPFCSEPASGALPANSLFSELNNSDNLRRGRRGNRRKFMFASFDDASIFLDDGEVLVTYKDLKNELKNLDSIIP
jgi:hypothetical protein